MSYVARNLYAVRYIFTMDEKLLTRVSVRIISHRYIGILVILNIPTQSFIYLTCVVLNVATADFFSIAFI